MELPSLGERELDVMTALWTGGGGTVAEVLDRVFADNPRLRGYVVDEHGALRKHMVIFIDGQQIVDRERLGYAVRPQSELYVMQALSGG